MRTPAQSQRRNVRLVLSAAGIKLALLLVVPALILVVALPNDSKSAKAATTPSPTTPAAPPTSTPAPTTSPGAPPPSSTSPAAAAPTLEADQAWIDAHYTDIVGLGDVRQQADHDFAAHRYTTGATVAAQAAQQFNTLMHSAPRGGQLHTVLGECRDAYQSLHDYIVTKDPARAQDARSLQKDCVIGLTTVMTGADGKNNTTA